MTWWLCHHLWTTCRSWLLTLRKWLLQLCPIGLSWFSMVGRAARHILWPALHNSLLQATKVIRPVCWHFLRLRMELIWEQTSISASLTRCLNFSVSHGQIPFVSLLIIVTETNPLLRRRAYFCWVAQAICLAWHFVTFLCNIRSFSFL